jgi:hypothetical protein
VVFSFFETKTCISHILISNERFMALDKNLLGVFNCEHTKMLSGFAQMSISAKG